jgi:uncharacterized protein (TIGR02246 family)
MRDGRRRRLGMGAVALAAAAAVAPARAETKLEAEVRERSRAIAAAEARLDAEEVMPFWAEDAVVHMSGAEPLVGREAIHRMFADVFPKLKSFRGEATEIHVAAGGDLAWETGRTFSTRLDLPDAKESSGKYLLVWRKDPDGMWRIAACAPTANPKPAP